MMLVTIVLAGSLTVVLPQWDRRTSDPEVRTTQVDLEHRITEFTAALHRDGGYRPPEREERRAVAEGVGLLLDGRQGDAERRLSDVGYGLRILSDRPTGRRFAEIAELTDATDTADPAGGDRTGRGWGRIYADLDSPPRWSVQVPHPMADLDTERLGVGVLRGAPGGVLVLAGAHRAAGGNGEADVAHRRDTVFHAVCGELVDRGLPGIQVHGFADDSVPGYEAVVSTGRGVQGRPEARELARSLSAAGLEVCRAWSRPCKLAGRTNQQGRRAAAQQVPFLHLEFSRTVRADGDRAAQVVAAMAATASGWT